MLFDICNYDIVIFSIKNWNMEMSFILSIKRTMKMSVSKAISKSTFEPLHEKTYLQRCAAR